MSLIIVTFEYFIPLRWPYLMKVFMTQCWYNVELCNILAIKYIIIVLNLSMENRVLQYQLRSESFLAPHYSLSRLRTRST